MTFAVEHGPRLPAASVACAQKVVVELSATETGIEKVPVELPVPATGGGAACCSCRSGPSSRSPRCR